MTTQKKDNGRQASSHSSARSAQAAGRSGSAASRSASHSSGSPSRGGMHAKSHAADRDENGRSR